LADLNAVFDEQLTAFNEQDLDRFLATYAPDALVVGVGAAPLRGRDELRRHYRERFADASLRCEALATWVAGPWLFAHERISGEAGEVEVAATFEIGDGVIARSVSLRRP
jgi:hypothetical protein